MYIAAIFTVARTWMQPRCSSADKWIRKLRYIYTMEYYSVPGSSPGGSREIRRGDGVGEYTGFN